MFNETVNKIFTKAFEAATIKVAYDTDWENGTGYFDGGVTADLGLAEGEVARSEDPNGRRIIFVGTAKGNVVVFDRRSGQAGDLTGGIFVSNVPSHVRRIYSDCTRIGTALDATSMLILVGSNNVGKRLS